MPANASATAPQMPNRPDVPLSNRHRLCPGPSTASSTAPNPETSVLPEDLPFTSSTDEHGAAQASDTDPVSESAISEGMETGGTTDEIQRCATASHTAANPDNYLPGASHATDTECEVEISQEEKTSLTHEKKPLRVRVTHEETLEIEHLFAEDIAESLLTGRTITLKKVEAKRCGRLLRLRDRQIREKIRNIVKHKKEHN
ncbi:hypothetical protein DPMN_018685 [Dreissena polymorpha]|uniref:Uncharacterized protein n=1 Tax=Dreissena polymorpha TaxID=45954 RepID=A0A9D4S9F5_DREPO|nr:hypothetical protein DPMN_018685 [Dreissena polymorpha]